MWIVNKTKVFVKIGNFGVEWENFVLEPGRRGESWKMNIMGPMYAYLDGYSQKKKPCEIVLLIWTKIFVNFFQQFLEINK